jgi:hypothetical protein
MHHEGSGARGARGSGQGAGVADAAADAREKRCAPADLFGDVVDHGLGFRGGEPVELAGVAVGHQDMHAGRQRAVDDRPEAPGRDPVAVVERRDENAGDARQARA